MGAQGTFISSRLSVNLVTSAQSLPVVNAMAPKEMIKQVGVDGFDLDDYKAQIAKTDDKRLHIVDVFTTWCGPCLSIVPTFKNLQINIDAFEDRCTITQLDRTVAAKLAIADYDTRFP